MLKVNTSTVDTVTCTVKPRKLTGHKICSNNLCFRIYRSHLSDIVYFFGSKAYTVGYVQHFNLLHVHDFCQLLKQFVERND